jgi:DNA-binding response OmpR family regulator
MVVGDEPRLADAVQRCLGENGQPVRVLSGRAALNGADGVSPDLVILDLVSTDLSGIGLCRRLRARTRAPIIVLAPKVPGLDELLDCATSVDDYITKPFRPQELAARVRSVLQRRACGSPESGRPLACGDLRIDPRARSAFRPGRRIKLTPKEFGVLYFLAAHAGQIYSREQLLYNVWEEGSWADPSTITIHIRRLRLKVEEDPEKPRHLKTVWGAGYKFEP